MHSLCTCISLSHAPLSSHCLLPCGQRGCPKQPGRDARAGASRPHTAYTSSREAPRNRPGKIEWPKLGPGRTEWRRPGSGRTSKGGKRRWGGGGGSPGPHERAPRQRRGARMRHRGKERRPGAPERATMRAAPRWRRGEPSPRRSLQSAWGHGRTRALGRGRRGGGRGSRSRHGHPPASRQTRAIARSTGTALVRSTPDVGQAATWSPKARGGQAQAAEDYAEQLARQPELCGRWQNMHNALEAQLQITLHKIHLADSMKLFFQQIHSADQLFLAVAARLTAI